MPERRLQMLRSWRETSLKAAKAIKRAFPEASVYLLGGAVAGRLTVLSDIDLAVVFDKRLGARERVEILARIWEELEKNGIPAYYPLHIIILGRGEIDELKGPKVRLV